MRNNTGTVIAVAALLLAIVGIGFALNPKVVKEKVGAIPNDSVDYSCFSQNGVKECRTRVAMIAATTTPCAINLGQFGSSTLISASIIQDLASTSVVSISKSNTQYATTTLLQQASVTANTQPLVQVFATSTPGAAATTDLWYFGPGIGSKFIVFGIQAGATTLNGPTGICEAVVRVSR